MQVVESQSKSFLFAAPTLLAGADYPLEQGTPGWVSHIVYRIQEH